MGKNVEFYKIFLNFIFSFVFHMTLYNNIWKKLGFYKIY